MLLGHVQSPLRRCPGRARRWTRPFDHQSFFRWYFKPALTRAGLERVRFHDLRHTYASMMLAAGLEPYKVSRWMGHANLATTDSIYAHLYVTDYNDDAARVGQYLARQA